MKKMLTLICLALALSQALHGQPYFLNNDNPKEWAEKLAHLQAGAEWDAELRLPYPIIFIHGLIGDKTSWEEVKTSFELALTYGGELPYCLNSDNNLAYSNITSTNTSDIRQFVTSSSDLKPGDFYLINFDVHPDGTNDNDVQSNQAAIVKQGVALGHAIASVLSITGRKKVILVGHSMGGLCARMYLQTPGLWTKPNIDHQVAKLVTSGTPHGGCNVTGGPLLLWFPLIDEESDAVRDMRWEYSESENAGVFLFGGKEDADWMDDFSTAGDFYNVDVSCNGFSGENFAGLNNRAMPENLDVSCIVGEKDIVVDSDRADINGFLSKKIKREWFLSPYGHTSQFWQKGLTQDIKTTTYALDEPDDYHLAYGIERNREYQGFLTVQDKTVTYTEDYDDYRFTMPQSGFVKALAWSLPPMACLMNIVRAYDETILAQTLSGGAAQMSTSLTWLPAGDYYFEMAATSPNPAYWNNVYSFRLEHNGSSPTAEPLAGLQVNLGPNPTTGPLSVTLSSEQPVEGVLSVVDFAGRTLHTLAVSGAGTYPLDLSSQAAGLYIVTLRTADGVGAWTVVKE